MFEFLNYKYTSTYFHLLVFQILFAITLGIQKRIINNTFTYK